MRLANQDTPAPRGLCSLDDVGGAFTDPAVIGGVELEIQPQPGSDARRAGGVPRLWTPRAASACACGRRTRRPLSAPEALDPLAIDPHPRRRKKRPGAAVMPGGGAICADISRRSHPRGTAAPGRFFRPRGGRSIRKRIQRSGAGGPSGCPPAAQADAASGRPTTSARHLRAERPNQVWGAGFRSSTPPMTAGYP